MKMKLLSTFFAMLVFGAPKNHLKKGGVDEKICYFIAKWVHDYHAEKRIKGDYAYVSLALSF